MHALRALAALRHNVDPTDSQSDAAVRDALVRASLGHLTLGSDVDEGGANLSAGERQLVCLARVLVVKPRILLLDEATSSLDRRTDAAVQAVVRDLTDVTVISIAHRLETLLDYDRVMVLDAGVVVEYGPPRELAARDISAGAFASLLADQRSAVRDQ